MLLSQKNSKRISDLPADMIDYRNLDQKKVSVESPGIDPGASRMLSERSTI